MQPISLAAKVTSDLEAFAALSLAERREALVNQLTLTIEMMRIWTTDGQVEQIAKPGDRLLNTKEMAQRLGCSAQMFMRGAKTGRYPFVFKHGALWVGSEDGLERWIKARTNRRS
jgi:predicted DNA-binding transcriptional regulator AlpA